MTPLAAIMLFAAMSCLGALVMTVWNLSSYVEPPQTRDSPDAANDAADRPSVAVCIPARDEEANIARSVHAALAQRHVDVEVLVYDDESTDATPTILADIAARDPRLRVVPTRPLPAGWAGKQHACHRAAESATADYLLFTDADVHLEPDAARAAIDFSRERDASLVSTFPRQIVGTAPELALVPMIFFILFSYLPMARMRSTTEPNTCAACGQFLLARRDRYLETGGHEPFRNSFHDGIKMPRNFRTHGFRTDLFDGTHLASVRMYQGLDQTVRGFAKNAYEGLGSIGLLVFLTVLHALAHVLPWFVAPLATFGIVDDPVAGALALTALVSMGAQRALLAERFRHSMWLALAHPITVTAMTLVQWYSLVLAKRRQRVWRGRVLAEDPTPVPSTATSPAEAHS